ncbi:hypothetical protein [Streptomyces sp. NPDC006012]|uniref:hypothetical protein n=1 Tax=Streptomyces sp. NPDC006012 TaxID=3364739 RepID=UPI0036BEA386
MDSKRPPGPSGAAAGNVHGQKVHNFSYPDREKGPVVPDASLLSATGIELVNNPGAYKNPRPVPPVPGAAQEVQSSYWVDNDSDSETESETDGMDKQISRWARKLFKQTPARKAAGPSAASDARWTGKKAAPQKPRKR